MSSVSSDGQLINTQIFFEPAINPSIFSSETSSSLVEAPTTPNKHFGYRSVSSTSSSSASPDTPSRISKWVNSLFPKGVLTPDSNQKIRLKGTLAPIQTPNLPSITESPNSPNSELDSGSISLTHKPTKRGLDFRSIEVEQSSSLLPDASTRKSPIFGWPSDTLSSASILSFTRNSQLVGHYPNRIDQLSHVFEDLYPLKRTSDHTYSWYESELLSLKQRFDVNWILDPSNVGRLGLFQRTIGDGTKGAIAIDHCGMLPRDRHKEVYYYRDGDADGVVISTYKQVCKAYLDLADQIEENHIDKNTLDEIDRLIESAGKVDISDSSIPSNGSRKRKPTQTETDRTDSIAARVLERKKKKAPDSSSKDHPSSAVPSRSWLHSKRKRSPSLSRDNL